MKKIVGISLFCFGLAACAGNPPAWWNPGNIYSTANQQDTPVAPSATPVAQTTAGAPVHATEQSLVVQDESYEEMTLTPLQDEEGENDSGDSSAQNTPHLEEALPPPSILN